MYSIHTTSGFIISSRPHGEAGKLISIFTRDFGLVLASAQGIRLEKSKLRYHTQDYTLGSFSLVRGKELWRLTSASAESNTTSDVMIRVASLLSRLLHGEESHPELFEIIGQAQDFLSKESGLNDTEQKTFESIVVIRILHALGYIAETGDLNGAFQTPFSMELLNQFADKRLVINQHINKALRESQL